MKILIIEDEEDLLHSISNYLEGEQFECAQAMDLKSAKFRIGREKFDCFIIDIGLPDGSGLELIREIKQLDQELCIIIVSAIHTSEQKIEALNLGADDYLSKPFSLAELNARIHSVLRRYKPGKSREVVFQEILIMTDTHQVFIRDQEVFLTKKEFDLLFYFISNRNKVISKHALVEHLWGIQLGIEHSFDFLYAQIKNLRKKITAAHGKDYIQNINRIGYRFREF